MSQASISLRQFLLTRLLWLLLPIVLAVMATHWYIERTLLLEVFDESLEDKAMTLATLVTRQGGRVELEFADEYMPQYSRTTAPMYFQIWLPDGSVLERSVSLGKLELPREFGSLESPRSFWFDLEGSSRLRGVGIEFPLRFGTESEHNPATSVVVVVAADEELLEAVLSKGNLEVLVTGLLAGAGIVLVVMLALARGVHMLERVAHDVEELAPDSLYRTIDLETTPREIRPIAESLNRATRSIAAFVERERRFNADVAHELRTPLAELRATIDVARQWPEDGAAEKAIQECHEIAVQMAALVESLLSLSRLEGAGEFERAELDLAEFLQLQVDQARRGAAAPRTIHFAGPEHLPVETLPTLWEIIARNLLENALEHSVPGTDIELELRHDQGRPSLVVTNRVDGFDERMAARCTERLWRKDGQGAENHHFGLGLSLVAAAAEKLGLSFRTSFSSGVFGAYVGTENGEEAGS